MSRASSVRQSSSSSFGIKDSDDEVSDDSDYTWDFSLLGGVQAPTQLRRTRAPPLAERSYLLGGGDRYGAFPTFRLHKASQVNRLLG